MNVDKSQKQHQNILVGDKVWLFHRYLKIHRPNDKLDYHCLGPFLVTKQVNKVAYWLNVFTSTKIHLVFHVSLLEGKEEFEVSKIFDSRINRRKFVYLLHGQSYEVIERSWEYDINLDNALEMIKEVHRQYPTKPSAKDVGVQYIWTNTNTESYLNISTSGNVEVLEGNSEKKIVLIKQ